MGAEPQRSGPSGRFLLVVDATGFVTTDRAGARRRTFELTACPRPAKNRRMRRRLKILVSARSVS
jgi:hypothetical protein